MSTMLADARIALRSYLKTPLVVVGVTVSLALGVGTAATVLNLVDVLLLRLPDVPQPRELVAIYSRTPDEAHIGTSFPDFRDFRQRSQSLTGLAAYLRAPVHVESATGAREEVQAEIVTGNYFQLLRLQASQGRLLAPKDDVASAPPVVVVDRDFAREHFGDALALGERSLRINGVSFAVVGVAPEGFSGLTKDWGAAPRLWFPVVHLPSAVPVFASRPFLDAREARSFLLVGRLRPGVEASSAQADFNRITKQLARELPDTNADWSASVLPAKYVRFWVGHRSDVELMLAVIGGLVLLVWLVACANAATLLTTRMLARRRELLIRQALGASRARLGRQLLLEASMLAIPSALLAASCTVLLGSALEAAGSLFRIPIRFGLALDARSLLLVAALTIASALFLVLLSAVSASRRSNASSPMTALLGDRSGEGTGVQRGPFSLRRLLVLAQVAGAATLLVVSALLIQSVRRLQDVDAGFDANAPVVMTSIDLSASEGVSGDERVGLRLRRALLERLRTLPGVQTVSLADRPPLSMVKSTLTMAAAHGSQRERSVSYTVASSDYFHTIGLPLVAGRSFRESDAREPMPVVVNQLLAQQLAPDGLPLGQPLVLRMGETSLNAQVVGVATNAVTTLLREAPAPHLYVPHTHVGRDMPTVLLRTTMPPGALEAAARGALRGADSRLVTRKLTTFSEMIAGSMAQERLLAGAAAGAALVAMLLAVLGLYGLTTYFVVQRRRELGIRMAMGASRRDMTNLVLTQGLVPALAGVAVGLAAAALASTALASVVYGIAARDPLSYVTSALLLLAVMIGACLGAVRRAWRIDPAALLRTE
ncbi:MAG: ABC transporter permease [Vicinamibacteraceae bacterium]